MIDDDDDDQNFSDRSRNKIYRYIYQYVRVGKEIPTLLQLFDGLSESSCMGSGLRVLTLPLRKPKLSSEDWLKFPRLLVEVKRSKVCKFKPKECDDNGEDKSEGEKQGKTWLKLYLLDPARPPNLAGFRWSLEYKSTTEGCRPVWLPGEKLPRQRFSHILGEHCCSCFVDTECDSSASKGLYIISLSLGIVSGISSLSFARNSSLGDCWVVLA